MGFRRLCIVVILIVAASQLHAQGAAPGAGIAVDSLHNIHRDRDSLLFADSVRLAMMMAAQREAEGRKQFATQREIDLTNDGKPEVLRLSGYRATNIDDTKLTLTIKSGNKLIFEDSWTIGGWFDTIDHLSDSTKLRRARKIVTTYFANENFLVMDSADFVGLFNRVEVADLDPKSEQAHELFREPRVMFSVFKSRDYWYGIVWDPRAKKFVKIWHN